MGSNADLCRPVRVEGIRSSRLWSDTVGVQLTMSLRLHSQHDGRTLRRSGFVHVFSEE